MLTADEKNFASEFLQRLESDDLIQITKTVTYGSLKPINKDEAISMIVSHEQDVDSLLSRKKITKSAISNYLHYKNVEFPGTADKQSLIEYVKQFWKNPFPPINSEAASNNNGLKLNTYSDKNVINHMTYVQNNDTTIIYCNNTKSPDDFNDDQIMNLALKFSEWYYSLINNEFSSNGGDFLGPEHFWSDASTFVKLTFGPNSIINSSASTASESSELIRQIRKEYNLYFAPNLSQQGVKGKTETHGAVLVLVCGTLHTGVAECVGLFEQIFLLLKDPLLQNNWKIKKTDLILKNQANIHEAPSITQGELVGKLAIWQ